MKLPPSRFINSAVSCLPDHGEPHRVRARVYPVFGRHGPVNTDIFTFADKNHQLPVLEAVFSGLDIQPRIRQVRIIVFDRQQPRPVYFTLFFKNHRHLRPNWCVRPTAWRGDIVVMRVAKSGPNDFAPMRDMDDDLADFAVEQFTLKVRQKPGMRVKEVMTFSK